MSKPAAQPLRPFPHDVTRHPVAWISRVKPLAAAAAMCANVLVLTSGQVHAQSASSLAVARTPLALPAQALPIRLGVLSRQFGVSIGGEAALLEGKLAPALNGSFDLQQAMDRTLENTGLTYVRSASTLTVLPATEGRASTLAAVTVTANAPSETASSRVEGFIARRTATATKTDTPISEIAQSISVVTRDQMEAQGVQTVEQALRYTAGVLTEVTGYDLRYASLNIRGFDATLYRDGLRVFKTGTYGDWLTEPQGVERVEVLKGPSAVLYGQGGPGGIVNQISKRPTSDAVNEVNVSAGNHGRYQAGFDLGRTLDADGTLMFRLNGMGRDSRTQTAHSQDDRMYLAPALTWKPSAQTSLTILADVTRDRMTPKSWWPNQSLLGTYAQGRIPVRTFAGEPEFDRYDRDMHSLGYLLEHRFDDTLTLRQQLRRASFELDYQHVYATAVRGDQRSVNRASLISRSKSDVTTVDTSVQKETATGPLRHTLLLGLDYQRFSGSEDIGFGNAPVLDIFNPVYGRAVSAPVTAPSTAQLRQLGLYAQDQIRWDRWIVTAGLRHDRADTVRRAGAIEASAEDGKTTGSVGAMYRFDNGISPYASYATAFVPVVGSNYRGTPQPETSEQFELGVKFEPAGAGHLLTAAVFDLRRQNVTTLDPTNPLLRVQTGEVRARGLELEGKSRLSAGVDLIASYTYLDAEITRSNDPAELGKRPFQTARQTAKLWLNYAFRSEAARGWSVGAGLRRVGPTVADTYNRYWNAGYTLIDAAVRYDAGPVRFSINVANLTDEVTTANRAQFYGQDRTVTATLGYRW